MCLHYLNVAQIVCVFDSVENMMGNGEKKKQNIFWFSQ